MKEIKTFEEFKTELSRQIGLNAKYFKPKEVEAQVDLVQTMRDE